jgi:hypothetical protein
MATGKQFFNWNKPRHHPIFAYPCDFAPEPPGLSFNTSTGVLSGPRDGRLMLADFRRDGFGDGLGQPGNHARDAAYFRGSRISGNVRITGGARIQ